MVKLDPVEILKENGLWTDEFRTRMDMIRAVMNRDFENPILKNNLTPEQMKQMTLQSQAGGAFSVPDGILEEAKAAAAIPEAKSVAEQGIALASGASDKINGAAANTRAAIQNKLGKYIQDVPGVEGIKKKFEGKDPVTGLARELDYEKSDGFLTMVVKMFLNAVSDVMGSPVFPTYVRAMFGLMFMLSYLQGLPIFGGLIRAALEITTFIVTTIGTSILSTGNMAGPIGHMIGLMFASVFFVLSAMISFSRKQFTDALVISANLIPFVGMPISNALQRADIAAKKLDESRKQVYNSFIDLLGAVFEVKGRVRGGMRFSRRRRHTKKWRTMRRRFVRR